MKLTHNGKRYDTDKMITLAQRDLRSYSNNYAGTRYLSVASDGALCVWQDTNGQDCHITDDAYIADRSEAQSYLEGTSVTLVDEGKLVEMGLLQIVE
jgi:hypothetical protein